MKQITSTYEIVKRVKEIFTHDEMEDFKDKLYISTIEEGATHEKMEQRQEEVKKIVTSTPHRETHPPTLTSAKPPTLTAVNPPTLSAAHDAGNDHQPISICQLKPTIFAKLANPLQVYLQNIPICNGLVTNPLLQFLRNLVNIQNEPPCPKMSYMKFFQSTQLHL